MSSNRKAISTVTLSALALAALVPGVCAANPLLSGYGGPGQGSQMVLGSTLLGGGGGSSGAGAGAGAAGTAGGSESSRASSSGAGGATPARKGERGVVRKRAGTKAGASGASSASGAAAQPSGASSRLAASESHTAGTPTLGLSSEDLVYTLLALGALITTAALTRRLTRRPS